jgi:hypothetical protein
LSSFKNATILNGEGDVETNDDVIAANQKFFDEHGYWNVPFVESKRGYPKQEVCDDLECYHRFPEHILVRDMQRNSAPDEALRKSCVWSKICEVRDKYKISVHSDLWIELCRRRGTILDRMGWFTPPFVHREPLLESLEALRRERPKRDAETKADLNAKLAVKELTRY